MKKLLISIGTVGTIASAVSSLTSCYGLRQITGTVFDVVKKDNTYFSIKYIYTYMSDEYDDNKKELKKEIRILNYSEPNWLWHDVNRKNNIIDYDENSKRMIEWTPLVPNHDQKWVYQYGTKKDNAWVKEENPFVWGGSKEEMCNTAKDVFIDTFLSNSSNELQNLIYDNISAKYALENNTILQDNLKLLHEHKRYAMKNFGEKNYGKSPDEYPSLRWHWWDYKYWDILREDYLHYFKNVDFVKTYSDSKCEINFNDSGKHKIQELITSWNTKYPKKQFKNVDYDHLNKYALFNGEFFFGKTTSELEKTFFKDVVVNKGMRSLNIFPKTNDYFLYIKKSPYLPIANTAGTYETYFPYQKLIEDTNNK